MRDVASTVRGKPGVMMVAEEQASMPPPTSAASLSGVDAPVVRPDNAGNLGEEVAPVVMTSDQQTKQALMEDMIKFPEHVYLKARELSTDQRLKLAGQLAAEVLKRYPHLIQQLGSTNDPVPAWTILRNVVIRQLEQHLANEPVSTGHEISEA
jgi:hypothetical protein